LISESSSIGSSYLGIAWLVELVWLAETGRQPECVLVLGAERERVAPAGMNPNSRLGTSPHRGGWVMDAETEADRFVGIDVSKARVDVHVRPEGSVFYCTTDTDGLAELVGRLTPLRPRLVVLEASGGYEGVVAAALAEAGLPVAIVNPPQVRKFAGAIGRLAKTDAIDAGVIAHFTFESGCGRDTDSLLEQMRFEPSVPHSAGWLVEI
jgi:hypothetical protein